MEEIDRLWARIYSLKKTQAFSDTPVRYQNYNNGDRRRYYNNDHFKTMNDRGRDPQIPSSDGKRHSENPCNTKKVTFNHIGYKTTPDDQSTFLFPNQRYESIAPSHSSTLIQKEDNGPLVRNGPCLPYTPTSSLLPDDGC